MVIPINLNTDVNANRFWIMRHGQSLANVEGIVVSDPENGVDNYGLSATGISQVELSYQNNQREVNSLDAGTMIVSSDFKRARETATIMHRLLACDHNIEFDSRIRERYFGQYELASDCCYPDVWSLDEHNADHEDREVESVNKVARRVVSLLESLDYSASKQNFLLVAHGDVLQILQTVVSGMKTSKHRSMAHLETAEIRQLWPQQD